MKITMKKFLTLILSIIMLVSVMPMSLSVAAETEDGFEYEINGGKITISAYNGSASEVIIPDTIEGYPVTIVGSGLFCGNSTITKVTLGKNVEKIGNLAFGYCSLLAEITIGTSLKEVGKNAFLAINNLVINYEGSPEQWEVLVANAKAGNNILSTATKNFYFGHDCSTGKHILVKVPEKAPDCTENGNDEYWDCRFCELNFADEAATTAFTGRTVIDALGHDMADATCTEPSKCRECDFTEGLKKEHNPIEPIYVAPTCTKRGYIGYTLCADCEATLVEEEYIPALGHKYVKNEELSKAPTCDENAEVKTGLSYEICSVCGDINQEEIPAPEGHTYEVWTESEESPAICIALGIEISSCTVCGKIGDRYTESNNPNNHSNLVPTEATPNTCDTDGNIAYWSCEGCHKIYSDADATTEITAAQTVIPKKNHAYGDTWEYDEETGMHKQICANDNTHINSEACADVATDEDCNCDKCGHLVAHSFGNPTCIAPATCSVCPATEGNPNPDNHTNLTRTAPVAPDCINAGNIEYWSCSGCSKIYSDAAATTLITNTADPATGHAFGDWEYDEESEQHKRTCANDITHIETGICSDSAEDEDCKCDLCDRLIEHDFADATCCAPKTCRDCGATEGEINEENHDGETEDEVEDYVEATCTTKESYNIVTYCLGCNEPVNTVNFVGEKDPDKHKKKEVIPNGGKDKEHYYICENEGCDLKEETPHDLGEYSIYEAPSCTKKGRERACCEKCRTFIYRDIDVIAHVDANKNAKCDVCDAAMELPADPAPENPAPEKPPVTEEPSAKCSCNCHATGLRGLFFSIILFFQRLLGINKECICGKAHY